MSPPPVAVQDHNLGLDAAPDWTAQLAPVTRACRDVDLSLVLRKNELFERTGPCLKSPARLSPFSRSVFVARSSSYNRVKVVARGLLYSQEA